MRMYSAQFENVAVTVAQDLFEIAPAANKSVIIHAIYLSQSTEIGDAMEEQLRIQLIRGNATTGSGGSTPTPVPLRDSDAAAGAVVKANNTTIASTGTPLILHSETFNVRTGWIYLPTPEMQPRTAAGSSRIVLRLLAAPGDSVSMSGTIYFEES
jgi:hypothetical protein